METVHTRLQEHFSREFTTAPSAVFDFYGLMRDNQKSSLTNVIWMTQFANEISFVKPAQYFLYKLTWPAIINHEVVLKCMYDTYLQRKYPNVNIIFDGYETAPTIKDLLQIRRILNSWPHIDVNLHACLDISRGIFLSNNKDKNSYRF